MPEGLKHARVRSLSGVRERPTQRVNEDDGAAGTNRERITPEAQRQPQRDSGSAHRVDLLPRHLSSDPGDPQNKRVHGLVEPGAPKRDSAQERFGMGNGRWAGIGGGRRELSSLAVE